MTSTAPVKTGKKQGGRFSRGQSGNPKGRPRGTRNAASVLLEQLIEGESEQLIRVAIDKAKAGDGPLLRAFLPLLVRPRRMSFELPPLKTAKDAIAAIDAVA